MELSFIDWDLLISGETQVTETRLPESDRDVVIVVADGFRSGKELVGAVVLAKPVRSLQSWVPLAGWFLVAAAVSLTVSMLLAFMLARRLSRPLHEITLAASAVAEGDFSHRVAVRSEDEIGHLADAFRYMSDEVQKAQEQQREFVINVSHELKTPLTAIAGHVQALKEGIATDPVDVAKSVEIVSSQTKRLSRLIEDLLSLAKFDARQFGLESVRVPLSRIIDAVEDTFSLEAQERRLELVVAGGTDGITLTTDPDRLRQVLSNLVHNAMVHTPPDGRVEIKARRLDGKVELSVADTGTGIPAADLSHIFERFYRSGKKAKEAGLGLGLAISRELVQAMGGEITVKSKLGEGTTFTVTLPG
jgi:signal transduction histidine kinase